MTAITCLASRVAAANWESAPPAAIAEEIAGAPSSRQTMAHLMRVERPQTIATVGTCAALAPQFLAREAGAIGERLQLDPDDARMHFASRSEAGETAIGAGDDIVAPDRLREAADALGDQFRVLDDIR